MIENSSKRDSWIKEGYVMFASAGPEGLKIERLSKQVKKNKSSFYHHFADLEVFTSLLLDYHLQQAKLVSQKEAASKTQEELVQVILDHKLDLLFNRQLRIHRENKEFANCFNEVNKFSIPAIIPIWKDIIGLHDNSYLAELVLQLSLENFFLQITAETLNANWLNNYLDSIRHFVSQFENKKSIYPIDGSV
ncbi:TetR/AcrR family transcriptional regulator [Algoriphagus sp.]|uniref:TetR/AcrR family transcriptional regulator n=1 Tax=Algoriphagus sp. TaxID=1872435 RepID=UPI0025D5C55B|nr:TetR/AcrR family transcriptional regulator [Algoriphagus sp.]